MKTKQKRGETWDYNKQFEQDGGYETLKEGMDSLHEAITKNFTKEEDFFSGLLMQKDGKLTMGLFYFENKKAKKPLIKHIRKLVNSVCPEATFLVFNSNVTTLDENDNEVEKTSAIFITARTAYEMRAVIQKYTTDNNGNFVWGTKNYIDGGTDTWLDGCNYQKVNTFIELPPKTFSEYLERGLERMSAYYNKLPIASSNPNLQPSEAETIDYIGKIADLITHYEQTGTAEDEATLLLIGVGAEMQRLKKLNKSEYLAVVQHDDQYVYALPRMGADAEYKMLRLAEMYGDDWVFKHYEKWIAENRFSMWIAAA